MAVVETIKIEGDSSGAVNAFKKTEDAAKKTGAAAKESNKAIDDGLSAIDKRTGGAVSAFKSLTGGIKSAVTGFKTLKGAVIATGLGALLIAITSLVAYFKRTEEGAQTLRVIMAALGQVVDKLMDVAVALGKALTSAFSDPQQALKDFANLLKDQIVNRLEGLMELIPALGKAIGLLFSGEFKEAGKVATDAVGKVALGVENVTDKVGDMIDGVSEFGKELAASAAEAARLERQMNAVKVAERELITERAKANKQIAEARLLADDVTKSTEERIAAVELAGKLEQQVADKEIATQKKRLAALSAQAELASSNEETLQAIAEAQARVTDLETQNIMRRKRLQTEVIALRNEELAKVKELEKAEEAYRKLQADAEAAFQAQRQTLVDQANEEVIAQQQKEINAVYDKYFAILEATEIGEEQKKQIIEKQNAEIAEIEAKYAKGRIDQEKAVQDSRRAEVMMTIDAVQGALGSLFGESKAIAKANVLVDSAQAAIGIIKSSTSLPEPAASVNRGIQLAALAASTIASLRNISQAQPGGAATPSTPATPSIQGATPSFNVVGTSGINQLAQSINQQTNQPLRAYVVGGDITSSQELERKRIKTATFG